ncbi:MAG: dienelactone hydrolase family protein [Betaproteobacteria bacterium]|nr:dienelactone hydrolase family protein [Betaproteobacteria bacterium]
MAHDHFEQLSVQIPVGEVFLEGNLALPEGCAGVVLFAHGSGSSRFSPRNQYVASELFDAGVGSLLIDLLTPAEDEHHDTRFDIALLTQRLLAATAWLRSEPLTQSLKIGYFGASTGAAAALQAAASKGNPVAAVVSRGGRPDLAGGKALGQVTAPTLLIVGGYDDVVIQLNQQAHERLHCTKELVIVPGATHLFEEPGTLEQVAKYATLWFRRYFGERLH